MRWNSFDINSTGMMVLITSGRGGTNMQEQGEIKNVFLVQKFSDTNLDKKGWAWGLPGRPEKYDDILANVSQIRLYEARNQHSHTFGFCSCLECVWICVCLSLTFPDHVYNLKIGQSLSHKIISYGISDKIPQHLFDFDISKNVLTVPSQSVVRSSKDSSWVSFL